MKNPFPSATFSILQKWPQMGVCENSNLVLEIALYLKTRSETLPNRYKNSNFLKSKIVFTQSENGYESPNAHCPSYLQKLAHLEACVRVLLTHSKHLN
jgi:hypothetical protein